MLGLAFAALSGLALYSIVAPSGLHPDQEKLVRLVRNLELRYGQAEVTGGPDKDRTTEVALEGAEEIEALRLRTDGAKGVAARIALILRQVAGPTDEPDFSGLTAATDDVEDSEAREDVERARTRLNEALRELYSADELSPERAKKLRQTLLKESSGRWPYSLAAERADELAGLTQQKDTFLLFVAGATILLILAGLAGWTLYLMARASGRLKPVGVPMRGASVVVADSLGMRMFLYLLALAVVFRLVGGLAGLVGAAWASAAALACVILIGVVLIRQPILGVPLTLSGLGLSRRNLGKNVLWGLGGLIANVPALALLGPLGYYLFRWIPSGEHPVSQQLYDPGGILASIVAVAFLAPVAEEMFFRGCLYQGLALRMRSAFWPILISSFAFAAIHPQGGVAWPALAWIGAMGAMLTRQTGSLVPALVMHALHNGSILALALLLGR
ncbi:MAG: CPBP family intramembrane metalloprotease [Armatimonadetes bacterium]|nr:CPBP family intramembrane metalloprotease [Armatimonadota bacterium]